MFKAKPVNPTPNTCQLCHGACHGLFPQKVDGTMLLLCQTCYCKERKVILVENGRGQCPACGFVIESPRYGWHGCPVCRQEGDVKQ